MSTVLVVGAGAVGRRAARQLVETDGVERLLVADEDGARAREVVEALGEKAEVVDWNTERELPAGVDLVAAAAGGVAERHVADRALEARVPVACAADDHDTVMALLGLDRAATEAGVTVAVGCGLAPGLADVLARHGADGLDAVDEIHVARSGSAGPACVRSFETSGRGGAPEWRDGDWVHEKARSGRQLVWFPAPVGGRDCRRGGSGQAPLLVDAFPNLSRVSLRLDDLAGNAVLEVLPFLGQSGRKRRTDPDGEWGAVWVEVRGRRGRTEEVLVYGAVDRISFAAGTVLAVAAANLRGLAGGRVPSIGAHGLGALMEPVPFLGELARRGVTAATFEGASF